MFTIKKEMTATSFGNIRMTVNTCFLSYKTNTCLAMSLLRSGVFIHLPFVLLLSDSAAPELPLHIKK